MLLRNVDKHEPNQVYDPSAHQNGLMQVVFGLRFFRAFSSVVKTNANV